MSRPILRKQDTFPPPYRVELDGEHVGDVFKTEHPSYPSLVVWYAYLPPEQQVRHGVAADPGVHETRGCRSSGRRVVAGAPEARRLDTSPSSTLDSDHPMERSRTMTTTRPQLALGTQVVCKAIGFPDAEGTIVALPAERGLLKNLYTVTDAEGSTGHYLRSELEVVA